MNLLARREHSRQELERKLLAKGFPSELIDDALQGLQRERLLDDARFAEAYAQMRIGKGYGPMRIRGELRERGVDEALVTEQVSTQARDWGRCAREARIKRFGEAVPREARERARQMRFLQYRGFTMDHIKRALGGDEWD